MEELKKIIIANRIEVSIPTYFDVADKQLNVENTIREKIVENAYFKITDEDVELNFILMDEEFKSQDMAEIIQNLYNIFSRLVPGFTKIEVLRSKINGIEAAAIQYKSNALTYDLYNMYVIYNSPGKKFAVNAHCKYDESEKWQSIFFQIAESVKII
ncbi:hypothetical protein [Aminipila sp.]|uniref:hypothetical protein n=1 Tax=Aminipila sp. TaxID=2060095 RepID=UPI00289E63C0|nr:hypothetical protein [Aminipila sp.]